MFDGVGILYDREGSLCISQPLKKFAVLCVRVNNHSK